MILDLNFTVVPVQVDFRLDSSRVQPNVSRLQLDSNRIPLDPSMRIPLKLISDLIKARLT